jgi:hypothetical protein
MAITITTAVSIVFYSAIVSFIIFLILLVVNSYVTPILPFISSSNIPTSVTQPSVNTQSLFTTSAVPPDQNLVFNQITNFSYNKFAISFDCFVKNTYLSTDVPRVVLYFADSPVTISDNTVLKEYNKNDEMPSILTISDTDILSRFTNTNFIAYVDPVKNDMKIGLITMDSSNNMYLELLPTLQNIPINEPFKVTINITPKFVEVYRDFFLSFTYTPKYTLNSIIGTPYLYGPISFIKDTVQIGNIQYFDNIITSSQVRTLINTTKPASFFH